MKELKFRNLLEDEILIRFEQVYQMDPQTGLHSAKIILYKTSRTDQTLLDEVVGPYNWSARHEFRNGQDFCTISIRNDETGEWVAKEDVGTENNFEPAKSAASDAMKRAGTLWGIGRELYSVKNVTVPLLPTEVYATGQTDRSGRAMYRAKENVKLYVRKIRTSDKKIVEGLVIVDGVDTIRFATPGYAKTFPDIANLKFITAAQYQAQPQQQPQYQQAPPQQYAPQQQPYQNNGYSPLAGGAQQFGPVVLPSSAPIKS